MLWAECWVGGSGGVRRLAAVGVRGEEGEEEEVVGEEAEVEGTYHLGQESGYTLE